jgi:hypothetical protein
MLVGVFAAIGYLITNRAPDLDPDTNCPTEANSSNSAIFFVLDTTGDLSATQQRLIKNIFFQVVSAAKSYDHIQIFEVSPAKRSLLNPLFSYCKPGKTDKAGPVVAKFREKAFNRNLQRYFDAIELERPKSPIIEAIGSVAASFPQQTQGRHLIIASDLLENSDLLNQYRADWLQIFNGQKAAIYAKQPRLEGVDVSLLFIPRSDVQHHDKEFVDWWINFLEESGADVTHQEFEDPDSGNSYYLDPFIPITG